MGNVENSRREKIEAAVDALPKVRFDPEKPLDDRCDKCLVCQSQYEAGEIIKRLPCTVRVCS